MRPYEHLSNRELSMSLSNLKKSFIDYPEKTRSVKKLKFLEKEFIHRFPELATSEQEPSNRKEGLDGYSVYKMSNGQQIYYGRYGTREEADSVKKMVDILHSDT